MLDQSQCTDTYIYKTCPDLIAMSKKLYEDSSYVKFFSYIKMYDNGEFSDLCIEREWTKNYCNKYLTADNQIKRLACGINYWRRNTNQEISSIAEDARNNFDIDARIEFIVRDNILSCYHMYSFCSNSKNADKAYRFYDLHRAKLLKFISYFNQKAAHLISEADMPENRVQISNYSPPNALQQAKRDYAAELLQENASNDLKDREFEIMLLYANGCTERQIAEMLNRSQNTVSTYLRNIREKTGCHDKRSLHRYAIERGYGGLEQFFFPYIKA